MVAALLAAPELIALARFRDLYTFVQYSGYTGLTRLRGDERERRHLARTRAGTAGSARRVSGSTAAGHDLGGGRARPLPGAHGDAGCCSVSGRSGASARADPAHAVAAILDALSGGCRDSGSSCRGSSPRSCPRGRGWRRCLRLRLPRRFSSFRHDPSAVRRLIRLRPWFRLSVSTPVPMSARSGASGSRGGHPGG